MKIIIIPILALALILPLARLSAQATYPLKTLEDSLPFRLIVRDRQLAFDWLGGQNPWAGARDFAAIQSIRLQDGDLMLDFIPPKNKPALTYTFDLWIMTPAGRLLRPQALRYLPVRQSAQAVQTLAWEDIAEALREAGAEYTLFIRRSLMGAVNCLDGRPEFTLARQLPFWVAGSAGALMIGAGQLFNSQKKDLYDSYRTVWREEGTGEAAGVFLDKARQKEKTARALTYAGWATLGASAVWYAWQRIRIQKKQKIYDTFCRPDAAPALSFGPVFLETPASASLAGPTPGFAVRWSF